MNAMLAPGLGDCFEFNIGGFFSQLPIVFLDGLHLEKIEEQVLFLLRAISPSSSRSRKDKCAICNSYGFRCGLGGSASLPITTSSMQSFARIFFAIVSVWRWLISPRRIYFRAVRTLLALTPISAIAAITDSATGSVTPLLRCTSIRVALARPAGGPLLPI